MDMSEEKIEMRGLRQDEVDSRIRHGLVNKAAESGTKTKEEIIRRNVLTPFNLIFIVLAILLLIAGKYTDITFLGVVICNTLIGTIQELKSKEAVDKLTILSARKYPVIREEGRIELPSDQLVRDDVVELCGGDQIPADAVILSGKVKVNESLLTGEEDDIEKTIGDTLHSGSACTTGKCLVRLTAVGDESYASRLSKEATTNVKIAKSDMMRSLDRLIMVIGFMLVPIGILLFCNEYLTLHNSFGDAIQSTVAALIGMIPEGLYLLTSVALAASVLRLTQKRVLVRDLNCVETLARIDTLCVDKTGTITEPGMKTEAYEVLDPSLSKPEFVSIMSAYAHAFDQSNETGDALKAFFRDDPHWHCTKIVPFTSSIKYSAASFSEGWNVVVGAPQFIYREKMDEIKPKLEPYLRKGMRVLLAVKVDHLDGGVIHAEDAKPLGLIILSNNIRKNAADTFAYFARQKVRVKVISGDDPETVSRIAAQVHIPHSDSYVDASTLTSDEDIAAAVAKYTVFGRTTPAQKKKMVVALQKQGHHVAMTGDGVNDVLALKEADCGIAMASGSDAASQIAQLVLLDSNFSAVPEIVAEGRRVINNIDRSARLFLSKNIFSVTLSIMCVILHLSYPLKPLQLSFISALTIGIPGFFLAMQPNDGRIKGHFLSNVLYHAFPGGLCELILIGGVNVYASAFGFSEAEANTMAVIIAMTVGLVILYHACKSFNLFRGSVLAGFAAAALFCIFFFDSLLSLTSLSLQAIMIFILFMLLTYPTMQAVRWTIRKLNRLYHWILDHIHHLQQRFTKKNSQHA